MFILTLELISRNCFCIISFHNFQVKALIATNNHYIADTSSSHLRVRSKCLKEQGEASNQALAVIPKLIYMLHSLKRFVIRIDCDLKYINNYGLQRPNLRVSIRHFCQEMSFFLFTQNVEYVLNLIYQVQSYLMALMLIPTLIYTIVKSYQPMRILILNSVMPLNINLLSQNQNSLSKFYEKSTFQPQVKLQVKLKPSVMN